LRIFLTMKIVHTIQDLRLEMAARPNATRVLVPTMGNLHDGHLSLIRTAREHGDFVIVSVFVNRLQFEPHGDFEKYFRTLKEDAKKLEQEKADLLFAPDEKEMYPEEQVFRVTPPEELSRMLEGETRPNFFGGVCTVIMKLFCLVQPNVAVFGKKDYQQLLILQWMVSQFGMPIRVIPGENIRDQDGLALSSRNGFLTEEERKEDHFLYQTLVSIREAIKQNPDADFEKLEGEAVEALTRRGWKPFYVAIRERKKLRKVSPGEKADLIVLAAAQLGNVRLIDNLEI